MIAPRAARTFDCISEGVINGESEASSARREAEEGFVADVADAGFAGEGFAGEGEDLDAAESLD